MLILDHDFERRDGRTGLDLTRLLRAAHPWGAVLPICYWSGRIDGPGFLAALRDGQMFAPSSYVQKGTVEVVDVADQAFQRFRDTSSSRPCAARRSTSTSPSRWTTTTSTWPSRRVPLADAGAAPTTRPCVGIAWHPGQAWYQVTLSTVWGATIHGRCWW